MIPKITQDGPNIMEQYWCGDCGQYLPTRTHDGRKTHWNFCPICGKPIEWDKAVPVKWEPMNCDTCGQPMIRKIGDTFVGVGTYVGTTICRSCMTEYCSDTNCLGCTRGTYPNCRWMYLKRKFTEETL